MNSATLKYLLNRYCMIQWEPENYGTGRQLLASSYAFKLSNEQATHWLGSVHNNFTWSLIVKLQ